MGSSPGLLDYETTNAALAWAVVAVLVAAAVERAAVGASLWAGVAVAVAAVALVPPVLTRRHREMVAWEVLALAAFPVVAPYAGASGERLGFMSVAALALVVAVELDAFTGVEMTSDFAVVFVVVVTMAVAGLWVIARFAADAYLGTATLADQTAVMWDLIAATVVGVAAGLVFEFYVRRISPGRELARERWEGR
jgi:hypothetical protein